MLYKVEARNPQGDLLNLEFDDMSDGIVISDIQGLDPVKATLVSSKFAQLDGAQFNAGTREPRNLLFEIPLEPDYVTTNVFDVRSRLYDFFMSNMPVSLRFYDDGGLTVDISGIVESCEAPLFAEEPVMNLSIMCFDPDFIDIETATDDAYTVSDSSTTTYAYPGSVPVGYQLVMNLNRDLTEFTIYHQTPDGTTRQLDFSGALLNGDVLTISTVKGDKRAEVVRSGTLIQVLYWITPQSSWTQLSKGDNLIRVYAEGAAIPYTFSYLPRYGGL